MRTHPNGARTDTHFARRLIFGVAGVSVQRSGGSIGAIRTDCGGTVRCAAKACRFRRVTSTSPRRATRPARRRWLAAVLATGLTLAAAAVGGVATDATSASAASASPSGLPLPADVLKTWKLTFRDDFTGSSLSPAWGYPYTGHPDAYTTWSPSHVGVRDGKLVISEYRENGKFVTGGVALSPSQTYGNFQIRMRVDKSDDMTYAVLLWPSKGWPPEIDIAEDGGGRRQSNASTLIYGAPTPRTQIQSKAFTDFSQWHTVGVEWSPGKVAYTLDGRKYGEVTGWKVPSQPMFLAIQTQSGGCQKGWVNRPYGCPSAGIPPVANLEVDWVAVYTPR